MDQRRRLFVYGTLQPQASTRMGRWVGARLEHAQAATVPGRLFAIRGGNGWFPALVPAKSGARVRGTLCDLVLAPGDLARLDRYEGREYRRMGLPVRTDDGTVRQAQVYLWRIALPPASPVIGDGDFLDWLRRTRRASFTTPRNGA
ncbi:gamma-glutamylcyclotransferase family protein [Novosphingobium mangrovi (ex Huang et al. 2023)]|uniref:Putative gamma-glutamylcyclotransferase n=1 Tax=Novosphingobium mangrovi (ex Huang et al. 2023) TaxID=2976432 RepID=A0ABT2I2Z6_9SPHN|nr:gamma-glutamylcyclotransferase family protein [Novosphingobium mangrovi (ex Huang et al. 2023)]MCT2399173.1 gamma-glutamylcyclotransferase [Novosphingobium mangrovi (ex Huang et al. 2023)]